MRRQGRPRAQTQRALPFARRSLPSWRPAAPFSLRRERRSPRLSPRDACTPSLRLADRRSPLLTPRSAAGLCASLGRWMSVSSGADSRTLFLTSSRSHFPAGPPAGHRPSMLPQPPNPFSGDQPSTPSRLGRLQPQPALSSYRLPPNVSSPSATHPSKSIDASSASHPPLI